MANRYFQLIRYRVNHDVTTVVTYQVEEEESCI